MTAFVWQHSPANPGSLFLSGPRLPFYRYQLIPAPQLIQLFCSTDTGVINPHAGLQGGGMAVSIEGQVACILGFVSHPISVTTNQLCSAKGDTDSR